MKRRAVQNSPVFKRGWYNACNKVVVVNEAWLNHAYARKWQKPTCCYQALQRSCSAFSVCDSDAQVELNLCELG